MTVPRAARMLKWIKRLLKYAGTLLCVFLIVAWLVGQWYAIVVGPGRAVEVVVVGGLGSLRGAFLASLLIGLLQTFATSINASLAAIYSGSGFSPQPNTLLDDIWRVTVAQVAPILPYLLLIAVLIFKPAGLFGNRET